MSGYRIVFIQSGSGSASQTTPAAPAAPPVPTRDQLRERLQGPDYEGVERTMDVHIRNLRRKIEPDRAHPVYLLTETGAGYRLVDPTPQRA